MVKTTHISSMSMMSILNSQCSTSFLNMVYSTEKNVHFFKDNIAGLGDKEDNKECQETIDATKEEERVANDVSNYFATEI